MISLKDSLAPKPMVLQGVHRYGYYILSHGTLINKMIVERGTGIDHSTLNRWGVHHAQALKMVFHKNRTPRDWWRAGEIQLKVKGEWPNYH